LIYGCGGIDLLSIRHHGHRTIGSKDCRVLALEGYVGNNKNKTTEDYLDGLVISLIACDSSRLSRN